MASLRTRAAKSVVRLIGLKRRLRRLADLEDDADALRKGVARLRRTDRRRPPWPIRRTWDVERFEPAGSSLFLMRAKNGPAHDTVLLYLHGGGYLFGPFGTEWAAMRRVASGAGTDFAMFMYPRAPEHDARETLQASATAYRTLLDRYGPGKVVLVGTSAGGGLAVSLMASLRDAGSPLPPCAVLLSPGVDMTLDADVAQFEPLDVMLPPEHVRSAGRIYARDLGPDHPVISPIRGDLSGLPTIHVFVGDSEILRPSIESFAGAARAAGTEVVVVLGRDAQHTWPAAPTPEGRRALTQIIDIIRTCS